MRLFCLFNAEVYAKSPDAQHSSSQLIFLEIILELFERYIIYFIVSMLVNEIFNLCLYPLRRQAKPQDLLGIL